MHQKRYLLGKHSLPFRSACSDTRWIELRLPNANKFEFVFLIHRRVAVCTFRRWTTKQKQEPKITSNQSDQQTVRYAHGIRTKTIYWFHSWIRNRERAELISYIIKTMVTHHRRETYSFLSAVEWPTICTIPLCVNTIQFNDSAAPNDNCQIPSSVSSELWMSDWLVALIGWMDGRRW